MKLVLICSIVCAASLLEEVSGNIVYGSASAWLPLAPLGQKVLGGGGNCKTLGLGVPPPESESTRERIKYIALTLISVVITMTGVMASALFIYRNVSVNLEDTLFSLAFKVGTSHILYQLFAIVFLRQKLLEIFEGLLTIYNENKNRDSFHLLEQTNEKCERIWPIYFKYVFRGVPIGLMIITVTSVLLCYFLNGHFDGQQAFRPFKLVLPWNQTAPFGYLLEIGYGTAFGEVYLLSNGSLLILFVSMCLHHQTFYKMYRNEARKLNDRDNEHRNDAEHLSKMVSFHISVKDWFLDSAKTYSTFILILLISSMLLSACTVFQLDLQMKHPDLNFLILVLGMIVGLSNLFAYCYCGKMATESYEKMADSVYDANWYELDPKLQKHIIVNIMANTQRPIHYHGFGVAVLNLETFLDFIRAIYTYYMIFKTLTSD